jgi:DNA topoisomerase-1
MASLMAKKNLVIVESPAKAKTIGKFLGPDFEIKASFGHVRDLPDKKLGVDIKKNFLPTYVPMKDKAALLKEIQSASKKKDIVYIATDPDREGEAIAWHIKESAALPDSKVQRIVFHEITEKAVKNAILNGRDIDMQLVDAQQARRILDRLIGYKLSPFLSKKIRRGLSAGRVQSVAVKLICDREREIQAFIPEEYWNIDAALKKESAKTPFLSRLFAYESEKKKLDVKNADQAGTIVKQLKTSTYTIFSVKKTQLQRSSQPPFITSSLQQEASRKLNWTAKKTMMIAQQLYEGVDINGESIGLITYMRTDSTRISDDAKSEAIALIASMFGQKYVGQGPKAGKKKATVQDAHEAIRPTYPDKTPDRVKSQLGGDHFKLYKLIWDRFMASLMSPAQLESTSVIVEARSGKESPYYLKTTGSVVLFDGFTTLYTEGSDSAEAVEEDGILPPLEEGQVLNLSDVTSAQKFTQPPYRYTEATLVKELEEKGIGRPSTYAPTLSVIQDRGYVLKEKKNLLPSELGQTVNGALEQFFAKIVDSAFTATMEQQLDDIINGSSWQSVIQDFYPSFEEQLKKADSEMEKIDTSKPSDEICEKCSSPMVIRAGRFGEFLACTNFPACKNTKSLDKNLDTSCPKCKQPLRQLRSKKGKVFYGCTGYPKCSFASWDEPLKQECPTCQSPTMFKKKFKGKETVYCAICSPPTKK